MGSRRNESLKTYYLNRVGLVVLCGISFGFVLPVEGHAQGRKDPRYEPGTFEPTGTYGQFFEMLRKYPGRMPDGNAVLVIGTVARPGEIAYGDGITVSKAIADAGGLGKYADSRHVGVWKRADGWILPVNLKDVMDKKAGAKDPVLEGGDVVMVIERIIGY